MVQPTGNQHHLAAASGAASTSGAIVPGMNESKEERTRFRCWLTEHGLTLTDAADLTGMSISHMSKIAKGQRDAAPLTKVHIARCLGARVAELFEVEQIPESVAS